MGWSQEFRKGVAARQQETRERVSAGSTFLTPVHFFATADSQYAVRVFLSHFEPHPVIADAQAQIAAAFQLLDLALPLAAYSVSACRIASACSRSIARICS